MSSTPSDDKRKALALQAALAEALLHTDIQNQFIADITRYTQSNKDLALQFNVVQERFKEFASQGRDNEQYAETWSMIRVDFMTVLGQSRQLAKKMAQEFDRYLETIVRPAAKFTTAEQIDVESIKALLQLITEFLNDCAVTQQLVSSTRDNLAAVTTNIRNFCARFDSYDDGKLSANAERVKQLQREFDELKGHMDNVQRMMTDATKIVSGSKTAATVLGVSTLMPLAALGAFASEGVAEGVKRAYVAKLKEDAQNIENKMTAVRQAQYAIKTESDIISLLKGDLELVTVGDIHSILSGSEYFRVLWAEITAEVQSIQGYLNKIMRQASKATNPDEIPDSLYAFTKTGTTLYYGLSRGLKLSADGIQEVESLKWAV